jgi:flagellar hook protein FlgE
MGLQSAMTTALTGLQAAETTIDVVGNNVANSNTVGFKESNVLFATQFLQTQSIGSAPSDTRGGTNPRQIGLGTKVAAINPDFTQGTVEISANPLDVAIQGDGFLMVQGAQGERLYTRNGQLQTNANNEVVTVTGNRVLGYTVDEDFNIVESTVPLEIPLGAQIVAQATETAFFSGVLSPEAEVGDTPSIIDSEVLGDVNVEFPNDPTFTVADFSVRTPPTVTATTSLAGAGSIPAGDYEYRVAFFTTSGGTPTLYEGPPSTSFGNITIPAGPNQDIQLTGLPTDGTGQWTGRNLYRSLNGGAYELVATLDATTADIVDNAAAGGAALDDDSLDQTNYSYYVTFYSTSTGLESRPTGQIGSLAVSDVNRRIRIDNIPQPAGADFNAVRIYRNTESSPSQFFLVDTLIDGETTYIDNTPDADIVSNPEVDLMGPKANAGTALTNLVLRDGSTYTTPFVEGVLTFEGKKGDRNLAPKEFTITATSTVQDLISFMDEAFGIDEPDDPAFPQSAGGQINSDGQIQFTANMGIENRLSVALSAFTLTPTGSSTTQSISIDFNESQEANGEGSTTDFVVFDSLGIPLNVRITTVMESRTSDSRTYRWYATSEDNQPSSGVDTALTNGTITFDSNGRIISGGIASVAVDRLTTGSQSPLEFELDFSQISGLDVRNNLGESVSTISMTRQDGFPPGSLTSFIITESGLIRGVFSNGTERPLGQMRMARFANNTGLQQVGDNMFTKGINSGEPIEGDPGDAGLGALTAGAVELSNTDIGQNLIELILASTQYRGGTRVITAAQQLLDELLSLRR